MDTLQTSGSWGYCCSLRPNLKLRESLVPADGTGRNDVTTSVMGSDWHKVQIHMATLLNIEI
eukprot:scaffold24807_cov53-Attheya_sp.AAC.2